MDRERVRKGLEWILDGDRFGFGENWHIDSEPKTEEEQAGYNIQMTIALLKEQEAVEPNRGLAKTQKAWFCGACGFRLNRAGRFCSKCGKPVKWNDK